MNPCLRDRSCHAVNLDSVCDKRLIGMYSHLEANLVSLVQRREVASFLGLLETPEHNITMSLTRRKSFTLPKPYGKVMSTLPIHLYLKRYNLRVVELELSLFIYLRLY